MKTLALVLTLAGAMFGEEFVNSKYAKPDRPIRTVLLMPAEVQVMKSGVKGSESMTTESDAFGQRITQMLVQQFAAAKVHVLPDPFSTDALKQNNELQTALTRLQNKYDTLSRQLHAKSADVRRGRYSLGDEVSTLGPAGEADLIVFIRGGGAIPTSSKKTLGWLTWSPSMNTVRLYVSLVDARSGDIVAIIKINRAAGLQVKTDGVVARALAESFKKLPLMGK
jgi:hypothetical protein